MSKTKFVLATTVGMLLTACGSTPTMSKDYGVSVGINTASQTLDSKAASRDLIPPTLDGVKAEKAMDRYRKDRPDESRSKLVDNLGSSN